MTAFSVEIAKAKADAIIEAEAVLSRYLHECFPTGARCDVFIMAGQQNPTPATIVSVSPNRYGGSVNVQIHTAKQRSRQRYRLIPAVDVVNVCNYAWQQSEPAATQPTHWADLPEGPQP